MNIEDIRLYCLKKKGTNEGFPFGETTLVFKVLDKMFALLSLEGDNRINLKCDPERLITLKEHKNYVYPGYHMNKKYWMSVNFEQASSEELKNWIDHSYDEVVRTLPIKKKEQLRNTD